MKYLIVKSAPGFAIGNKTEAYHVTGSWVKSTLHP